LPGVRGGAAAAPAHGTLMAFVRKSCGDWLAFHAEDWT
jgi:hypothetical protein